VSRYALAPAAITLVALLVLPGATAKGTDYRSQEIFRVKLDGSGQRNLTKNHVAEDHPAISRKGSLVFEREGGIATMSSTGSRRRQLVRISGTYLQRPVWSRDGTLAAFTSCVSDRSTCRVGVVGRDGSGLVWIENAASPTWVLGRRLVFLADPGPDSRERPQTIATANADGSDRAVIAHSADLGAYDFLPPTASPQGTKIAFAAPDVGGWTLYSMKGVLGSPHAVARDAYDPVWSPDGRRLLFTNGRGLWSVRADGTRLHHLRHGNNASRLPSWSPDGQRVAFIRRQATELNVVVVTLHTHRLAVVARDVIPRRPLWAHDGRRLFYVAVRA
jgi:Tol biopolymer transport system component